MDLPQRIKDLELIVEKLQKENLDLKEEIENRDSKCKECDDRLKEEFQSGIWICSCGHSNNRTNGDFLCRNCGN